MTEERENTSVMFDAGVVTREWRLEGHNILVVEFATQKLLTTSMFRLQEFYESPYQWIRGKYFDLETFINTHMDDDGNINYFNFWAGFNVPSDTINKFYALFDDLTHDEKMLKWIIDSTFDGRDDKSFYLIGIVRGDDATLRHELVHAKYHSDPVYSQAAHKIVVAMNNDAYLKMDNALKNMGYCNSMIIDEINAYLSTSTEREIREEFDFDSDAGWKIVKPTVTKLRKLAKAVLAKDDTE